MPVYLSRNLIYFSIIVMVTLGSCAKDDHTINLFPLSKDIELGRQMRDQIASDTVQFPLLNETRYSTAYEHIRRIRDAILNSGQLNHKDDFDWEVYLIHNDTVLNAFACPGGYLYVYTGIIKFLDDEAELAGVLAHELAHADRRHSTDQLTKAYGLQELLQIILGNNPSQIEQMVAQVAGGLTSLKFSRDDESEADEYAVRYLYPTDYHAPALGDFFVKMQNQQYPPAFLSTHPNPDQRVEHINSVWQGLGGKTGERFSDRYSQFKASLP